MKLFKAAKDLVAKQLDNLPGSSDHGAAPAGHHRWARKSDPVLEHLLRDFRSGHLRKLFFALDPTKYTDTLDVRLLAGTYNVAGKKPPADLRLHEWLDQWKHCWPQEAAGAGAGVGAAAAAEGPHIVAVGFQEVVPLSAGNVIAGPSSAGADAWDHALAATLNGDDWAARNAGRMFGSSVASQAAFMNLGTQAAYAAYSMVAGQAATVVGAMDKVWSGAEGGNGNGNGSSGDDQAAVADSAQQQQARLAYVLSSAKDGEDVYVQVACKQLVGLYLSVWARKRVARSMRGVQAASAATGWGGYLGNKGAVAVRLRVHDAPLVLVCSHLASGDAEGDEQRRNADVREILRRCTFDDAGADTQQQGDAAARQQSSSSSGHWGRLSSILDHDNVVWLGDLNYRLACSDEEARRCLRAGRLEALLQYDELAREMSAGRVFQGWQEGPLTFQPTYKYHLGCNIYSGDALPPGIGAVRAVDSYTSLTDSETTTEGGEGGSVAGQDSPSVEKQKKRTPAWCDRILWLPDRQLYQLAYGRGELAVSDHRPVAAAFLMQAHRYQRDKVQQLAEDMRRAVDVSSNAARPRCSLEPRFIELGPVPYGHPSTWTLVLTNTGPCAARFYFVAPPKPRQSQDGAMLWDDNQPLGPPWLSIDPVEGEVAQGEAAAISLTALIVGGGPGSAAAALDTSPPPPGQPAAAAALDAILILRLEDGPDSFVSMRGAALPSCFGMDLDRLLTLGDAPVLPVEALDAAGQALLQQGLAQQGPGQQQQQQQGASLAAQLDELGLAGGADGGGSAAGAAAEAAGSLGRSSGQLGGARGGWGGLEVRVPKEVQRLVAFLEAPHRLRTPGLFVESCQASVTGPGADTTSTTSGPATQHHQQQLQQQQLLAATAPVRWALDTGLDLPAHVTPHQAAAALLLLLQQLPEPLMPPDVSAVLLHCVPPGHGCAGLLSDTMSVAEWASLRLVLRLCRAALAPEAAAHNGLTLLSLAKVLSEHLFGAHQAAGAPSPPGPLAANRIAFVMCLLDAGSSADAAAQQAHEASFKAQQQQHQQLRGAVPAAAAAGTAAATPAGGAGVGGAAQHSSSGGSLVQRRPAPPQESLI